MTFVHLFITVVACLMFLILLTIAGAYLAVGVGNIEAAYDWAKCTRILVLLEFVWIFSMLVVGMFLEVF